MNAAAHNRQVTEDVEQEASRVLTLLTLVQFMWGRSRMQTAGGGDQSPRPQPRDSGSRGCPDRSGTP